MHTGTSFLTGKRRHPKASAKAAAPSHTRAARRGTRMVQTPMGSKPRTVLK